MTITKLDLSPAARKERTEKLLKHWNGHQNEWRILHGILCMGHAFDYSEGVDHVFDGIMIADRLDDMNGVPKDAR